MKKKIASLLAIFVTSAFLFAACKSPSPKSIQQKFKDSGYSITTTPQADLDKIAGASEGFYARKGKGWSEENNADYPISDIRVWIYKFKKKELAKEYADNTSKNYAVSLKNVFVCRVLHFIVPSEYEDAYYSTDSAEAQATLDIFNSFF